MNLRKQLLSVSLLTLIIPWAGTQFIRETEIALRSGQEQFLDSTAKAIADALSQFPYQMLSDIDGEPLYAHPLQTPPLIDGYVDDWNISDKALVEINGADGPIHYLLGQLQQHYFLYLNIPDQSIVYAGSNAADHLFDKVSLTSISNTGVKSTIEFVAEAPGQIIARRTNGGVFVEETRIDGYWRDFSGGYRIEARIPRSLLENRVGLSVFNAGDSHRPKSTSTNFAGSLPGPIISVSPVLQSVAAGYVQSGWRLIITNNDGWRLAQVGAVGANNLATEPPENQSGWLPLIYKLVLEDGDEGILADPAPQGRETQTYISEALNGKAANRWFRSSKTGRAIVSVAQPVWSGTVQTGAIILQQDTDAILSLTNRALTRLISFTLIATIAVAAVLLGYASWLSTRIRLLSEATEHALDDKQLLATLPSESASDEVGDLSRSFSSVLERLGIYNDYLRSLASKLSHELRTPLTIVKSSLENLEHESLSTAAREYTIRATEGTDRLQKILNGMSEASRTEELIDSAEIEEIPLGEMLGNAIQAYADIWRDRHFVFKQLSEEAFIFGSPELIIQMLDKLVDNAVEFSQPADTITVSVETLLDTVAISVSNPGPSLPQNMRKELFDSMVSIRTGESDKHLGLGLYIARVVAEGYGGSITANNTQEGVQFTVTFPTKNSAGKATSARNNT